MVVTRFAPSPTGRLHLGHARAALVAWRAARAAGGRFLLRIEDIDAARCREDFVDGICEDLDWLGVEWDGPVRRQSAHLAEYATVLAGLEARGLAYRCLCSRADVAVAGAPHVAGGGEGCDPYGVALYPGTCRGRGVVAEPAAIRLDMGRALAVLDEKLGFWEAGRWVACDPRRFGDVVLGRRGMAASYHLCVTHDDAAQGVTLVTRGADLLAATDIHRLLQALMGWPVPDYAHHAVLTDATGRRLAKRDRAMTIAALREAGYSPVAVRQMAEG